MGWFFFPHPRCQLPPWRRHVYCKGFELPKPQKRLFDETFSDELRPHRSCMEFQSEISFPPITPPLGLDFLISTLKLEIQILNQAANKNLARNQPLPQKSLPTQKSLQPNFCCSICCLNLPPHSCVCFFKLATHHRTTPNAVLRRPCFEKIWSIMIRSYFRWNWPWKWFHMWIPSMKIIIKAGYVTKKIHKLRGSSQLAS